VRWIGWKLTAVAERLTVLVPLLLELRQPLNEKIGESGKLQQHGSPLEGGIGEHFQPFAGEVALLSVLRDVEPVRTSGGSIDANPVHALPGGT
jgi:hypothetical protein